jgi:hypothetical protein
MRAERIADFGFYRRSMAAIVSVRLDSAGGFLCVGREAAAPVAHEPFSSNTTRESALRIVLKLT